MPGRLDLATVRAVIMKDDVIPEDHGIRPVAPVGLDPAQLVAGDGLGISPRAFQEGGDGVHVGEIEMDLSTRFEGTADDLDRETLPAHRQGLEEFTVIDLTPPSGSNHAPWAGWAGWATDEVIGIKLDPSSLFEWRSERSQDG